MEVATYLAMSAVKARNALTDEKDLAILEELVRRDPRVLVQQKADARIRALKSATEQLPLPTGDTGSVAAEVLAAEPEVSEAPEAEETLAPAVVELEAPVEEEEAEEIAEEEGESVGLPEPQEAKAAARSRKTYLRPEGFDPATRGVCTNPDCGREGLVIDLFGFRRVKGPGGSTRIIRQPRCNECRGAASKAARAKAKATEIGDETEPATEPLAPSRGRTKGNGEAAAGSV